MSRFGKRGPRGTKGQDWQNKPAPKPVKPAKPVKKAEPAPVVKTAKSAKPAPEPVQQALPFTVEAPKLEPRPPQREIPRGAGFAIRNSPAYEELRLRVIRSKGFPRAFYAHSLAYGTAPMDPTADDFDGGERGHYLRHRVLVAWEKEGGVLIQYEGRKILAAVVENAVTQPAKKLRKQSRGQ